MKELDASYQNAVVYMQQGRLIEAEKLAEGILEKSPNHADANHLLGYIAGSRGQYELAARLINCALRNNPKELSYYLSLGLILQKTGRLEDSLRVYDNAIKLDPSSIPAHYNRGVVLSELGQLEDSLVAFEHVIQLRPDFADAYVYCGNALRGLGRQQRALEVSKQAVKLNQGSAAAHDNLGSVHQELDQYDQAISCYQKAIQIMPDFAAAHYNLGCLYHKQDQVDKAITCYQKALFIEPDYIRALVNLGIVYQDKGEFDMALSCYQKALLIRPDFAECHNNLGILCIAQGRYDQAFVCFQEALSYKPDYVAAQYNLGDALRCQGRTDEAVKAFQKALSIKPDFAAAKWGALISLPVLYDSTDQIESVRSNWFSGVRELLGTINLKTSEGIAAVKTAATSDTNYYLNYQGLDDLDAQVLYGQLLERVAGVVYPDYVNRPRCRRLNTNGRIQVGFVSAFFYNHSIYKTHGRWITGLNKNRFEISLFYVGQIRDWATEELAASADHFLYIRDMDQLVSVIAGHELDILIYTDLGMETRLQLVSALRLAPVQCNGGGHPITSGLSEIDYFLGSELMEPADGNSHYSEELIRLPNLASCYPFPQVENVQIPPCARRDSGQVIYLNLQSLYKLLPQHDDLYPRIAKEVPGCRFWFISGSSEYITNKFRNRIDVVFSKYGMDADDYCVMQPRMSQYEYFGLAKSADIILDGVAWSGNNSSLEALAFDKPIVTIPGSLFRSRHSYAILKRMGVTDTIAEDIEDYIRIAVLLGLDESFRNEVIGKISKTKWLAYDDQEVIKELEEFLLWSINRLENN